MSICVPVTMHMMEQILTARHLKERNQTCSEKTPDVCFQVDQLINMADWKSVITWGKFEEITNRADRNKALQILLDRNLPVISSNTTHLGDVWPFPTDKLETIGGIVFRIEISRKTGRFEKEVAIPYMAG